MIEYLLCARHHNPRRSALFSMQLMDEEAEAQIGDVTYPKPAGQ